MGTERALDLAIDTLELVRPEGFAEAISELRSLLDDFFTDSPPRFGRE